MRLVDGGWVDVGWMQKDTSGQVPWSSQVLKFPLLLSAAMVKPGPGTSYSSQQRPHRLLLPLLRTDWDHMANP